MTGRDILTALLVAGALILYHRTYPRLVMNVISCPIIEQQDAGGIEPPLRLPI